MNDSLAKPPRSPAALDATLCRALLDSRQRWRDLVMTAADLAYETDAAGRFVFAAPDPVLGWSSDLLIGQPADLLLARGAAADGFNPFRVTAPMRRRRVWLKRADGAAVMLAVSAAPVFDSEGRVAGTRGLGIDWTAFDEDIGRVAAALRRGEVLSHILWRIGQEVVAPRMMQAALDALVNALGGEGAGVIDVRGSTDGSLLYRAGGGADEVLPEAVEQLASADSPEETTAASGRPILVATCHTRFGSNAGIALWRSPGARGWTEEDKLLVDSGAGLIRMVLEHEAIQREMAHQARTDPLTGLLNRRAFLEELVRHIDRLDREDQPGTLLYADLDGFKPVNDQLGHEAGDEMLQRTAALLRNTVRPSDLVARLGGDEFALWLDGADHLTAAERADSLCRDVPQVLQEFAGVAGAPTVSIGIASREPGTDEPVDSLLRRADQAMYEVKRAGRGHWRVAVPDVA
jgi:diguanylate cyclase (GGDEF)-like protein